MRESMLQRSDLHLATGRWQSPAWEVQASVHSRQKNGSRHPGHAEATVLKEITSAETSRRRDLTQKARNAAATAPPQSCKPSARTCKKMPQRHIAKCSAQVSTQMLGRIRHTTRDCRGPARSKGLSWNPSTEAPTGLTAPPTPGSTAEIFGRYLCSVHFT